MKKFIPALFISCAFLLTGCPSTTKHVLIFGDSISDQSVGPQIKLGNDDEYRVTYTSVSNGGIGLTNVWPLGTARQYWQEITQDALAGRNFDLVIVALGTNDCKFMIEQSGDYLNEINIMLSDIQAADASVPIVWLTINGHPVTPGLQNCSNVANAALAQSGVQTFPYKEWAVANPQNFDPDYIHHHADGEKEYAKWIHSQVKAFFQNQ